ncbi:hypothetical protein OUZ56_030085 [Daphnia magna]|uniref:Uncharacterized protein n=1 Tax=Daphnia magna TaxID=35525 RepID=A0ABQ9ZQ84_9CRUS|nr:hypothetical protein OUZ56_030085 [Daphnia magna]
MVIDSTKVLEVKEMCRKALVAGKVSLRNVASILGNSTSAIPSIPFAQSHYRSWGAVCDNVTTRGPWTAKQSNLHINCLELTGALYALQSFAKDALAGPTMVSSSSGNGLRRASSPPAITQSSGVGERRNTSPVANQHFAASRLEIIRRNFRRKGFSDPLVNLLVAENRTPTHSTYESAWRNWADWCLHRGENPNQSI